MSGLSKVLKMVIMGAPGSGKGTISARIVRDFGLTHLSTGDMLRNQILKGTDFGRVAKSFIDRGQLVPDDLMIRYLTQEMQALDAEGKDGRGWLLDGFPRTEVQAIALQKIQQIHLALSLVVPDEVIVERIRGRWVHVKSGRVYNTQFNPPRVSGKDDVTGEDLTQREDDKEAVVLERLQTYHRTVEPVLNYYRKLGILEEFHGRESNEIWPRIHTFLSRRVQPLSGPF